MSVTSVYSQKLTLCNTETDKTTHIPLSSSFPRDVILIVTTISKFERIQEHVNTVRLVSCTPLSTGTLQTIKLETYIT
jgi:hypothetical protein